MSQWITICPLHDILSGTGVCALVGEHQVAVFRPYQDEQVFATSNIDPFAQASVLSRGLIVEYQGDLWVASPLKKQHFRLTDGYCLEDAKRSIAHFHTRLVDGIVQVQVAH